MNHPPGLIVIPCQDLARYHRFTFALRGLEVPDGTDFQAAVGLSVVDNMNLALRHLKPHHQWAWMLGDDHVFDPDILMRLLSRQLDVVAPLCAQRMPPFPLVHYDRRIMVPDGKGGQEWTNYFNTIQYDELPEDDEPFEVQVTGSALLIRRKVLDAIGDPWYGTSFGLNEDLFLCDRIRNAGFKIYVDPEAVLGHIAQMIVAPQKRNGTWGLTLDFPGNGRFQQFYAGGVKDGGLGDLEAKQELVHA